MQRSTEQDSSSPIDQCCFLAHAQLDAQLRSHPNEWVTHQRDLPPCHLPTAANQGLLGDQMLTCLEIQHHTGPEFPKVDKHCGRFSGFPLTIRYRYSYSVGSRVGFLIIDDIMRLAWELVTLASNFNHRFPRNSTSFSILAHTSFPNSPSIDIQNQLHALK